MASNTKETIEGEMLDALALQRQLDDTEAELMQLEQFQNFVNLRKSLNDKWAEVRKKVEDVMVPAYKAGKIDKSIKGEYGSITVTESDQFDVDETILPAKYFKRVVDSTKIRTIYQLEGEAPKGCTPSKKYGIMIKLKS